MAELDRRPGIVGPHTMRAEERLKQGQPGDRLTRSEMEKVIGRAIPSMTALGAGNVRTAMRRVAVLSGVKWTWDRIAQCYRCVAHDEWVALHRRDMRLVDKRIRRTLRETPHIDFEQLDSSARLDHQLNQVQLLMATQAAGATFRKRLKKSGVVDQLKQPDPQRLIALMQNDGT